MTADLSPELAEAIETARVAYDSAVRDGVVVPSDGEEDETIEPLRTVSGGIPVCSFCGDEIPSTRYAYRKVAGFEKQRRDGGTNALRLREPLDEYACSRCVDEVSAGRDPGQGAIL